MKYMNHLRKLALLSSLALSYAVYADGTLPLPLKMSDPDVGLTLKVDTVGNTPRTVPLAVNGLEIQPCQPTEELYTATGSVNHDGDQYKVLGVCKNKRNTLKRTIVTTDLDATRVTTLDGTADTLSFSTFTGTLSHTLLMNPAPVSGGVPESETSLPTVQFILRR